MDVWVEDVKNAAKDEQLWGLKLRDLAARAQKLDELYPVMSQDKVHPMFLALKAHFSDDELDNCRLEILGILQDNHERVYEIGSNNFTSIVSISGLEASANAPSSKPTDLTRTSLVLPLFQQPSPIDLLKDTSSIFDPAVLKEPYPNILPPCASISPIPLVEDTSQPLDAAPAQFLTWSVHGDLSEREATSSISNRHNRDAIPRTSRPRRRNATKPLAGTKRLVGICLDDDPSLPLRLRIGEEHDEPCEFCASNSIPCYKVLDPRVMACAYCQRKKRGCSLVQKTKAALAAACGAPSVLQATEATANAKKRTPKPQARMESVPSTESSAQDYVRHTAGEGLTKTDTDISNSGAHQQSKLHGVQADTFSRPSSDIAEPNLLSSEVPAESISSATSILASDVRALSTRAKDMEGAVCQSLGGLDDIANRLASIQQTLNDAQIIFEWIIATFIKPISATSESPAPVLPHHLHPQHLQYHNNTATSTSDSQFHLPPSTQHQFFPPSQDFFGLTLINLE